MIKIIIHSTGSIAISSMFISGCGLFVSPTEKPTIEDHSGNLGVFSTVAQRRMVVTKKDYRGSDNRGMRSIWSGKYESKFCAEPPPDAAESIASTFSAVLQASAEQKGADLNLAGELARSLQTTVEELFNRTQGIQLFRDGMYNLCQAKLNGIINDGEFMENYKQLLDLSKKLIELEIEQLATIEYRNAKDAAKKAEKAKIDAEKAKGAALIAKQEAQAIKQSIEIDLGKINESLESAKQSAERAKMEADRAADATK